jgi:hypothetical protein
MITMAKLHSNTNGNSNRFRGVLCIIMSVLMLMINEMLFAVRIVSQRDNTYKNRCCNNNKENVQMKHFIYKKQIYIINK